MEENNLDNEDQEVVTQENFSDESTQSQPVQDSDTVKKVDEQDRNWRAMRQRQKEMEYEIKQKNDLLDRFMQQQQPKQYIQEIAEPEEADDEFIPAGKVKGIAKKSVQPLEKKIQELEQKIAQQEQNKLISSLRSQYSDFDDIVNVETLELLEKQEPELATTIAQLNDPYKMGLQSYKYIKALNIAESLPNARRSKEIVKKIEKNSKSVQSPQAYDKRPMAQAYKITEADQTKLYEEMMHYASKASGL